MYVSPGVNHILTWSADRFNLIYIFVDFKFAGISLHFNPIKCRAYF